MTDNGLVIPFDMAKQPTVDVPALDSKEARTAMTKCLNALDDLTDDQRTRVVRAVAVLYGIRIA